MALLRIRREQRAELRRAAREMFAVRAGMAIRARLPSGVLPIEPRAIELTVIRAMDRGRAYGVARESDVTLLAEAMILVGGDIERARGLGWARRWLVDETLGDLSARLYGLRNEAFERRAGRDVHE